MSHGNVPSLRTIFPADGQQAPWRSCCTTGLRAQLQQPLVLVLMSRTVPSSRASALCWPLWGLDAPRALPHAWRKLVAGGGCCKYV